jgi:hypothetical protein
LPSGSVTLTSLTFNWKAVRSKVPPVLLAEPLPELAPEVELVPLEFPVVPWISRAEKRMESSSTWMPLAGELAGVVAAVAVLAAGVALAAEVVAGVVAGVVVAAGTAAPEVLATEAASEEAVFGDDAEVFCDAWETCWAMFWKALTRSAKAAGDMD